MPACVPREMKKVIQSVIAVAGIVVFGVLGLRGVQEAERPDTLESACERAGARIGSAVVRQPWRAAYAGHGVEVQFCVLRGAYNSPLEFERNAEVVHFVVVGTQREPVSDRYTFRVTTSRGRELIQGPAEIEAGPGFRRGCRADVCQFITEPGEFVSAVGVQVENGAPTQQR